MVTPELEALRRAAEARKRAGVDVVMMSPDRALALCGEYRALLSQIEASKAETDRWRSAYEIAHDQATENGSKLEASKAREGRLRADLGDAVAALASIHGLARLAASAGVSALSHQEGEAG